MMMVIHFIKHYNNNILVSSVVWSIKDDSI